MQKEWGEKKQTKIRTRAEAEKAGSFKRKEDQLGWFSSSGAQTTNSSTMWLTRVDFASYFRGWPLAWARCGTLLGAGSGVWQQWHGDGNWQRAWRRGWNMQPGQDWHSATTYFRRIDPQASVSHFRLGDVPGFVVLVCGESWVWWVVNQRSSLGVFQEHAPARLQKGISRSRTDQPIEVKLQTLPAASCESRESVGSSCQVSPPGGNRRNGGGLARLRAL